MKQRKDEAMRVKNVGNADKENQGRLNVRLRWVFIL